MAPLSEVHNQVRPARRPAVYGRRRRVQAETREMHRQLFGTDENDIEKGLSKLTINAESEEQAPAPVRQEPKTQIVAVESDSPNAHPTKLEPEAPIASNQPEPETAPATKSESDGKIALDQSQPESFPVTKHVPKRKTARKKPRQPLRRRREREMAPVTPRERELLQPLLSLEYVHSDVVSFPEFLRGIKPKCTITKLGEGCHCEAFLLTDKSSGDSSVIKIVPFELGRKRNARGGNNDSQESSCNADDLFREIKVLDALTDLPGFARARGKHRIVRGKFPDDLEEEFRKFKLDNPEQALNDSPADEDDDASFYGVIEMYYAGTDLDLLKQTSCFDAFDIFWMATIFLARAERDFKFEHRDLHMSNFCFTNSATASQPFARDPAAILGRSGREITIIDYTLSRMQLTDQVVWDPRGVGGGSVEKPSIYAQDSQASQDLAIWRARRWCVQEDAGSTAVGDAWERYLPKTNVIWLGHLVGELRRRGVQVKDAATAQEEELQKEVWGRLEVIEGVLCAEQLDTLPESAEMLLERGMEEGWLAKSDILVFTKHLNSENA